MTPLEAAITQGAITALRNRQRIQAERADRGTAIDRKDGFTFSRMTGEAAIAEQLSETYGELADEFERELRGGQ